MAYWHIKQLEKKQQQLITKFVFSLQSSERYKINKSLFLKNTASTIQY